MKALRISLSLSQRLDFTARGLRHERDMNAAAPPPFDGFAYALTVVIE